jgi:GntP family gluconate:H+ symporter
MDPLLLLAIGTLVVVSGILVLRLHAFLALLLAALVVAWLTPSEASVGQRLATGFGETCAAIGLLIALASIIGKALLDSGAADRIVRSTLRLLGERRAPLAFLAAGFMLGVPVFFDTVVLLMLPLGKAMATRNERNYLLYILCIVAGASMTHSLVPPTPGPSFVAASLNVNIGAMMLGGLVVGAFASAAGFAYAVWANRRFAIPLRETDDVSLEELKRSSLRPDDELPALWLSVLPILLPAAFIAVGAFIEMRYGEAAILNSPLLRFLRELSDKNIAVAAGAAIALAVLANQKRASAKALAAGIQDALLGAGVVILITSAGGAFGNALEQSGVGTRVQQLATDYRLAVLPLAFLVTTLIRTAQGSATVAMITAGGILAGFAKDPAALGFHPVYLALAIGCGSKPFPWMNDSGFWLIGRMAGLTESETLKTSSTMIAVMGCAGMVVVLVLAKLLPMQPI